MKIKKNIKRENLPTNGRYYGSEQPLTELFKIIDDVFDHRPVRCDCDSTHRCWNCRTASIVEGIKGNLKLKIMEVFED
jgi:hypothetical protein